MAQWVKNPTSIHEGVVWVLSLALFNGLRIQHCHELQHALQTWLGSSVAVAAAQANSCSSDSTPGLATSKCHRGGPKKKKKKRKEEKKKKIESAYSEKENGLGIMNMHQDSL